MDVLVAVDGSDCGFRALEFAIEFVTRFEGTIHVIHVADHDGAAEQDLLGRVQIRLAEAGIEDQPELVSETQLANPRYADRVGAAILWVAGERDVDHIVLGHHGPGPIEHAVLGSTAETVVGATEFPTTVIP